MTGHRASRLLAATAVGAPTLWAATHHRFMSTSGWTQSALPSRRLGPLSARTVGGAGDASEAVVLMHGLISTGDIFGSAYDQLATARRLVVPDLLGFGRSMDKDRISFLPHEHLDALDELADRAGLFETRRWILGAHSMGSALALLWAARHPDRVVRIVCWGAPVYHSPGAARRRVAGSPMAKLFALDTDLAACACAISCRHRTAAGWLSAIAEPRLPTPIARAAPLHTWPAYRDAIRHLVLDVDWEQLVGECDQHGIEVCLVWGAHDRIGDRSHAHRITTGTRSTVVELSTGDHRLPVTDPSTCITQLIEAHR